jgi:hypothetical protein
MMTTPIGCTDMFSGSDAPARAARAMNGRLMDGHDRSKG